ncbi:hypothetical protein [Streptomyces sp. NPDC054946]
MTFSAQENHNPYLRAADYVAAALIFLKDNVLLTHPNPCPPRPGRVLSGARGRGRASAPCPSLRRA